MKILRNTKMMLGFVITITLLSACNSTNLFSNNQLQASTENNGKLQKSTFTLVPPKFSTTTPEVQITTPTIIVSESATSTGLSVKKSKDLIFDLLSSNGDCQLPCIWGTTPGKSQTKTLLAFNSLFAKVDNPTDFSSDLLWNETSSTHYFQIVNKGIRTVLFFEHIGAPIIGDLRLEVNFPNKQNIPINSDIGYYDLSSILTKYGAPSEVLIGPWPDEPARPNDWTPFDLVLFYPNNNFLIEYVMVKQKNESNFIGCLKNTTGLRLLSWETKTVSLKDAVKDKTDLDGINESNIDEFFLPTQKALNITADEFSEKYKKSEVNNCIEVFSDKWPYGNLDTKKP